MYLLRFGIRPVIEKEAFPRYHIGESMTGETDGLLRELGLGEQMLAARHPIKHGVKVYGNSRGHWFVPVMQRTPEGALHAMRSRPTSPRLTRSSAPCWVLGDGQPRPADRLLVARPAAALLGTHLYRWLTKRRRFFR
jgi:hypothetical protein